MQLIDRLLHRSTPPTPADPKPITARIDSPDGQHHVFKLGPGDAIGYAGIRLDIGEHLELHIRHYHDTDTLEQLVRIAEDHGRPHSNAAGLPTLG